LNCVSEGWRNMTFTWIGKSVPSKSEFITWDTS
jgi:hypothetical protein